MSRDTAREAVETIGDRRCLIISYKLLGAWVCVAEDVMLDELVAFVSTTLGFPVTDPALIADRLFGGFDCPAPGRRHVHANLGAYTYLNPAANGPKTAEERRSHWATLLQNNTEVNDCLGYVGGGPAADCPKDLLG